MNNPKVHHNSNNCNVCRDAFGKKYQRHRKSVEEMTEEIMEERQEIMAESKPKRYELPEEQQTEEAKEAEEEENLPAIMQEAFEMEDEMIDIAQRTNSDGTVVGYVESIAYTKKNGTIAIDVDLPGEHDLERFHFKKPKNWTREWKWVRFVEEYVGGADRVANFINMTAEDGIEEISYDAENYSGETIDVTVRRIEDDYEIVIPSSWKDYTVKLRNPGESLFSPNNVIWRLIPTGVGLYVAFLTFTNPMISGTFLPLAVFISLCVGFLGGLATGIVEAILGELFFAWSE